jgi:hypothetical protein
MHLGLGSDLDSCDKGDGVEDSLGVLLQFCYSGFDMAIRFGTELPTIFRLSMVCGAWDLCGRVGSSSDHPSCFRPPCREELALATKSACFALGCSHQSYIYQAQSSSPLLHLLLNPLAIITVVLIFHFKTTMPSSC